MGWLIDDRGALVVETLRGHILNFSPTTWMFKNSFFGNLAGDGIIHLSFIYLGTRTKFKLLVAPFEEQPINERCFLFGQNGPLASNHYPFSDFFGKESVYLDL